jgi:hypothetical protein
MDYLDSAPENPKCPKMSKIKLSPRKLSGIVKQPK